MTALSTLQIGLIASAKQTSGSDRYYFSLIRALRPLGVRVSGVVLGDPAAIDEPVPGIESFAPEGCGTLARWGGLRRGVGRLRAESNVVVSHFAPHAFPVLDVIRKQPLVVQFHGPWALEGKHAGIGGKALAVRMIQERVVYARARRIITLSRAFADILVREYRVDERKIRIIPGGVDLERFRGVGTRAEARAALGLPTDRPIVATVRRLAPTKGIENLIDAAIDVRRRVPDVLFLIAGTGSQADEFRERARRAGLEGTVRFAGLVPDAQLPAVYRAADLFVVPTVAFEGFGLVVLESLACGTPVLVTPVSGLPEVVRDLDPATILRGAEAAELARGIGDALTGALPLPDDARCIAYAERFSWSAIAARARDVYAEALA